MLVEDRVQGLVKHPRRRQVDAERLLTITRLWPLARPELPSMPTMDVNAAGGMARWNSPPGGTADLLLRPLHRCPQVRGLARFGGCERQAALIIRPRRIVGLGHAELRTDLLGVRAELLVGHGERGLALTP